MARTYELTDGSSTVNLINTGATGIIAQRGGFGGWRMRPNKEFVSSALAQGDALKSVSYPNIVERYILRLKGSSHDNAASQVQSLMELLHKADQYHAEGVWQRTPVYLKVQTTNETSTRYAVVYGFRDIQFPDFFDLPFEANNEIEDIVLSIIRDPFWRSDAPGTLPSALTLTHPDHPSGTATIMPVTNYRNENDLTHIYNYDASATAFSSNLVSSTSFDYYVVSGSTPAAGDMVYFGSTEGPFFNLVLNLSSVLGEDNDYDWQWEVWTGAAWTDKSTDLDDPSRGLMGTNVRGASWKPYVIQFPGWSNWAKTTINTVNAYWIRLRYVGGTHSGGPASQSTFKVYVCKTPYLEIGATILDGDYDALAALLIDAMTMDAEYSGSRIYGSENTISRVHLGMKSRGLTNFTSRLNIATTHNPSEWLVGTGTDTTQYINTENAPGDAIAQCTFATDATWAMRYYWYADDTKVDDWKGRYQVFLRFTQALGSAGDVEMKLGYSTSLFGVEDFRATPFMEFWSDTYITQFAGAGIQVADLGVINLPAGDYDSSDTMKNLAFQFWAKSNNGATPNVEIYDLIFIPIDEWSLTVSDPLTSTDAAEPYSALYNGFVYSTVGINNNKELGSRLMIDGGLQRSQARASLKAAFYEGSSTQDTWHSRIAWEHRGGEVKLPPDKQMRIYVFFENYRSDYYGTPPFFGPIQHTPLFSFYAHERWFSLRGAD